jgi:hypothetical protein
MQKKIVFLIALVLLSLGSTAVVSADEDEWDPFFGTVMSHSTDTRICVSDGVTWVPSTGEYIVFGAHESGDVHVSTHAVPAWVGEVRFDRVQRTARMR